MLRRGHEGAWERMGREDCRDLEDKLSAMESASDVKLYEYYRMTQARTRAVSRLAAKTSPSNEQDAGSASQARRPDDKSSKKGDENEGKENDVSLPWRGVSASSVSSSAHRRGLRPLDINASEVSPVIAKAAEKRQEGKIGEQNAEEDGKRPRKRLGDPNQLPTKRLRESSEAGGMSVPESTTDVKGSGSDNIEDRDVERNEEVASQVAALRAIPVMSMIVVNLKEELKKFGIHFSSRDRKAVLQEKLKAAIVEKITSISVHVDQTESCSGSKTSSPKILSPAQAHHSRVGDGSPLHDATSAGVAGEEPAISATVEGLSRPDGGEVADMDEDPGVASHGVTDDDRGKGKSGEVQDTPQETVNIPSSEPVSPGNAVLHTQTELAGRASISSKASSLARVEVAPLASMDKHPVDMKDADVVADLAPRRVSDEGCCVEEMDVNESDSNEGEEEEEEEEEEEKEEEKEEDGSDSSGDSSGSQGNAEEQEADVLEAKEISAKLGRKVVPTSPSVASAPRGLGGVVNRQGENSLVINEGTKPRDEPNDCPPTPGAHYNTHSGPDTRDNTSLGPAASAPGGSVASPHHSQGSGEGLPSSSTASSFGSALKERLNTTPAPAASVSASEHSGASPLCLGQGSGESLPSSSGTAASSVGSTLKERLNSLRKTRQLESLGRRQAPSPQRSALGAAGPAKATPAP
ncbi:unnamed protein product, partial [Discosporangium mesarthrocarpum]